ncbi:hypothetical protein L3Q82_008113 [Scortum barcoo]|uniref:Uncharacterized protein n=1 Tax=Scortum barcoo TaxID=214431 RepID=A0ACB8WGL9_9TELE|nr:hypothetical protein L3Q82_008113 [Scortum barcoo]
MMTQVLITLMVLSLWLQGHCQDVTQDPEISWSYLSKSAEMNCSHKKDAGHNQMYWLLPGCEPRTLRSAGVICPKSAEMNCSHKKDAGHNQMYWYRQRPGETMKLIVYTVFGGQPDYGEAPPNKYSAIKPNA